MSLRVTLNYQSAEKTLDFRATRLTVGRLTESGAPDIDLSPDTAVSRQHAVVEVKQNACWLTDASSRGGTQINGREIRGSGECRVSAEDVVCIGQTILKFTVFAEGKPPPVPVQPAGTPEDPAQSGTVPNILHVVDTSKGVALAAALSAGVTEKRLALLLDLPRQFSVQAGRTELLQAVMDRVVQVIPAARRGALLMRDPQQDTLLLRAYVSADAPVVSETLARRVLAQKQGFIWRWYPGIDMSQSVRELKIVNGMFAPVQWKDRVFGVICVDTPVVSEVFEETDLHFLIALGQIAGMSLSEQQTETDSQHNDKLLQRLLANFSPKLRDVLLTQAKLGKLRPGGTKSLVTILFCDICGFTARASEMDAHDVVDMLNQYFQPLTEAIFRHDGTVDKFLGDGVLAVFGSPEPDPQQHIKAVRAAVALQDAVDAVGRLRIDRGEVACKVRIGVHCGEVFHGFIGASDRLEFTVIGDAVNRARRFCEAAGQGEIWISPDLFQRVFNQVKAEKTTGQTKEGEITAYRVGGTKI